MPWPNTMGGRITTEGPAKGESSSNGTAEQAGQICREYARVFRGQLETKAKITLEAKDIIAQWMVRWAAMTVSRYHEGETTEHPSKDVVVYLVDWR